MKHQKNPYNNTRKLYLLVSIVGLFALLLLVLIYSALSQGVGVVMGWVVV